MIQMFSNISYFSTNLKFIYICLPLFTFVNLCSNDASMHKFCACLCWFCVFMHQRSNESYITGNVSLLLGHQKKSLSKWPSLYCLIHFYNYMCQSILVNLSRACFFLSQGAFFPFWVFRASFGKCSTQKFL